MAKDKDKFKKSKKGTEENEVKAGNANMEEEKIENSTLPAREKDLRSIKINIDSYRNVAPFYKVSDIMIRVEYQDQILYESQKKCMTGDEGSELSEDTFDLVFDANNPADLEGLISNPLLFSLIQFPGEIDSDLLVQLMKAEEIYKTDIGRESLISIYEAMSGEKLPEEVEAFKEDTQKTAAAKKGSKKKAKKSSSEHLSKSSKSSKKSTKSKKSKEKNDDNKNGKPDQLLKEQLKENTGSIMSGFCLLDLLPLFSGNLDFAETLLVKQLHPFQDERMLTLKNLPVLVVRASISKPLDVTSTILHVTLESFHNIPSLFDNMEFKVAVKVPYRDKSREVLTFTGGSYVTKTPDDRMKRWPGATKYGERHLTAYKLSTDFDIKNEAGVDVNSIYKEGRARIEFNTLKRTPLSHDDCGALTDHISKYRKLPVEIYCCKKEEGKLFEISAPTKPSKGQSEGRRGSKNTKSPRSTRRMRIACPLSTFHYEEASTMAGLEDSLFVPKSKPKPKSMETIIREKKKEKSSGSSKASKTSRDSSKKGEKSKGTTEAENLNHKLPPEPPPKPGEEPSSKVYNEEGERAFVIFEIELSNPLIEPRSLEDLTEELHQILPPREPLPGNPLTLKLAEEYYNEIVAEILHDLKKQHLVYREEFRRCVCDDVRADFVTYIRRIGLREVYLTSLLKAISMLFRTKFDLSIACHKNDRIYQNLLGEMFVYLVSRMNTVLNKTICLGNEIKENQLIASTDSLLFYAKEARELGAHELSDRYYMERICRDESNPDFWFDYAIHKLHSGDPDLAFECLENALKINTIHRNSLLAYAILLVDKNKNNEGETCFLTLLAHEPQWVEAWGVLYLFYELINNEEGMELCIEMSKKYKDEVRRSLPEDLAWTGANCPDTLFFKTAILLLKMRMYHWTKNALSKEVLKQEGLANYLLAVIGYYQDNITVALQHLKESKESYGSDYAVGALTGHCYFSLRQPEEAKLEYSQVIESFSRPDDMHLLYLKYSRVLEEQGDFQKARKLILIACKYHPTPYTWYTAGCLYYKQNDFLSAEECFSEANSLDNRIPEIWAYLALINYQLDRRSEGEQCYQQAVKNCLRDETLILLLKKEREIVQ